MIKIKANAINPGFASSRAFNTLTKSISPTGFIGVEASLKQYEEAINASINQLKELTNEDAGFIDAHIMILNDSTLKNEVLSLIRESHLNTQDAFECVIDKYIKIMQSSNNQYLKERYLDFLDIKTRVLQNLNKQSKSLSNLEECILLVDELFPSQMLGISKNVKGIIAKKGGFTSHSAILCRNNGIPYVVADFPDNYSGNIIIDNDVVIFHPSKQTWSVYSKKNVVEEDIVKDLGDVKVWANVVSNRDIKNITNDFSGIGLYRTEFVLMNPEYAFDIEKQKTVYEEALNLMDGRPITFRTFDIGDDKKIDYLPVTNKGIKNYYAYPKLFENQIKALLLASVKYPNQVKIMFPMIETFKQYQELKKQVVKIAKDLEIKTPPIGMMLETQSAVIKLDEFKRVDFFSVGTNDLCSELFNISREQVILFDELYEDLLNIIAKIIKFSNDNGVELSVCGELISKKEFAKKAIKLGLKNVSISSAFVNNIYKAINEE